MTTTPNTQQAICILFISNLNIFTMTALISCYLNMKSMTPYILLRIKLLWQLFSAAKQLRKDKQYLFGTFSKNQYFQIWWTQLCNSKKNKLFDWNWELVTKCQYETLFAVWYHLHNFKNVKKHPWWSVTLSKVAGWSL